VVGIGVGRLVGGDAAPVAFNTVGAALEPASAGVGLDDDRFDQPADVHDQHSGGLVAPHRRPGAGRGGLPDAPSQFTESVAPVERRGLFHGPPRRLHLRGARRQLRADLGGEPLLEGERRGQRLGR